MATSAAIIGGGIGGLTLANHLVQHGWTADVYERAPALPRTGTALGMWPEALAALDVIGCGDAIRAIGREQRSGAVLRPDGTVITRLAPRGGSAYLISRPWLLSSLAAGLP